MRVDSWLIALATVVGPMLAPASVTACGCTPIIERPTQTPLAEVQEQLSWADEVFLGRVADRTDENTTFSVEVYWKGSGASAHVLRGGSLLPNGAVIISDCDFGFAANTRYVVFAHRTPRGLTASSCGMTRSFEQAGELVRLLDRAVPRQGVRAPENAERAMPNLQMQPTRRLTRVGARLIWGRAPGNMRQTT